jgi:hypothetical protein
LSRVAENDALGFLLWNGDAVGDGVLGLSHDGQLLRNHRQPSDLSPLLNAIRPLAEGSLLLAGSVEDFDGLHGWVGKIDAAWNLTWETQLAHTFDTSDLVALPDGGALVRGGSFSDPDPPYGEFRPTRPADEWWVRIAATGEVLWQRSVALTLPTNVGGRPRKLMALTPDNQLRIAVVTADGTKLIVGALDGTSEVLSLDTTMADVKSLLALPDGRLALAGNDSAGQPRLALLEADGSLAWERSYGSLDQLGRGTELNAFAFDAARNELLVVGNVMRGSWMLAVSLAGDVDWELQRKPSLTNFDGDVLRVRPGDGPELTDVAVAADGTVLASGFSNRGLVYFMVGAGSCN